MPTWTGTSTGGGFNPYGGGATFEIVLGGRCTREHVPEGMVCVDPDFLKAALTLTHPDRHPESRNEVATKVSSYITAALSRLR